MDDSFNMAVDHGHNLIAETAIFFWCCLVDGVGGGEKVSCGLDSGVGGEGVEVLKRFCLSVSAEWICMIRESDGTVHR